jgi:hypothetical protein
MKKTIQLLAFLFVSSISFAQTITSITTPDDNIYCNNETKLYTVEVSNPTAANITLGIPTSSQYAILFLNLNPVPVIVGSGYTYTFTSNANLSTPGIQLDTFTVSILGPLGATLDSEGVYCTIHGEFFPDLTNNTIDLCTNGQPLDLFDATLPTDVTGQFIWADTEGSVLDPSELYEFSNQSTSSFLFYRITNSDGCIGNSYITANFNMPAEFSNQNITNSTCGNADGIASVDIIGSGSLYDVYWSTGFSETTTFSTSISDLSSGTYYLNVTDANNCVAVEEFHISDTDVFVSEVITPQTCNLNNGEIILTVMPPTGATFTSFWSNGVTTQNMVNSNSGEYSVEIHTDNNCNYFGTYQIPDNNIHFALAPGYPYDGSCTASSNGAANVIVTGGAGNLSYGWDDVTTGVPSPFSTMQNLSGAMPGIYQCTVTDNDNGCSESWNVTIPASTNVNVDVISVTTEDCGQGNGVVDVEEQLFGTPMITSWLWSNGATTEDLVDVPGGTYTLAFTDVSGCTSYLEATVPNTRPYQPQICLLTVDSSNTYNMVIWKKDSFNVVDGWNVYRETTVYGQFELVATIPYSDDAMYIDNAASPMARSWRYYITSFNSCGESYGSFIHKTIHTVSFDDPGIAGALRVVWDDYEGINYTDIDLMKHTDALGWFVLTTITTGNEYVDVDAALDLVGINYMVEFNLASPCNPGKAIDHNSSRSNKASSIFTGGGETGLSIIENKAGEILMYPNPTSSDLTIYIENFDKFEYFNIIDVNGKVVHKQSISNDFNSVSMLDFENGIYFVQIYSQTGVSIEKIIKQ